MTTLARWPTLIVVLHYHRTSIATLTLPIPQNDWVNALSWPRGVHLPGLETWTWVNIAASAPVCHLTYKLDGPHFKIMLLTLNSSLLLRVLPVGNIYINASKFTGFLCRYPPHGHRTVVVEEGVKWEKLWAPLVDMLAHDLHPFDCLNDLCLGDNIKIQCRRKKEFPYSTCSLILFMDESLGSYAQVAVLL